MDIFDNLTVGIYKMEIQIIYLIYVKIDLALNNHRWLMCFKIKPNCMFLNFDNDHLQHEGMMTTRVPLSLSHNPSLSAIALCKNSRRHLDSTRLNL